MRSQGGVVNSNRIQLSVALLAFLALSVALILPTAAAPQGQVTFTAAEDVTLDPNRSGNLNAYPLQLAVQAGPAKAPTKVFLLKFNIGADPLGSNTPVVQAALSLAAIGKQCSQPGRPCSGRRLRDDLLFLDGDGRAVEHGRARRQFNKGIETVDVRHHPACYRPGLRGPASNRICSPRTSRTLAPGVVLSACGLRWPPTLRTEARLPSKIGNG